MRKAGCHYTDFDLAGKAEGTSQRQLGGVVVKCIGSGVRKTSSDPTPNTSWLWDLGQRLFNCCLSFLICNIRLIALFPKVVCEDQMRSLSAISPSHVVGMLSKCCFSPVPHGTVAASRPQPSAVNLTVCAQTQRLWGAEASGRMEVSFRSGSSMEENPNARQVHTTHILPLAGLVELGRGSTCPSLSRIEPSSPLTSLDSLLGVVGAEVRMVEGHLPQGPAQNDFPSSVK